MEAYNLKGIRPYALGMIPFLGLFVYELAVVLPTRPTVADATRGFVIPIGIENKTVFMSQMDAVVLFGAFLVAAAISGMGFLRVTRKGRR
jgi:hypothetical protein